MLARMRYFDVVSQGNASVLPSSYAANYSEVRTHLALGKGAPQGRTVQRPGESCLGCTTIVSGYDFRKAERCSGGSDRLRSCVRSVGAIAHCRIEIALS
jgi:hypothetical protein